jgi:hypothetical protein
MRSLRPITSGSAPKPRRHSPSLMTATVAMPGISSRMVNVRPSAGVAPSMSK